MEVQRKIEAARFRLCQRYPFLARAVFAMVPVLTAEIPAAMGVDRAWRLYVNPELIAGWSVEETETVLYHEVLHLILDHAGRAEAMGVEPYNARAWNVAADAETTTTSPPRASGSRPSPGEIRTAGCTWASLSSRGRSDSRRGSWPRAKIGRAHV